MFDNPLLIAWFVAVVSLGWLIYLVVTWPAPKSVVQDTGPANSIGPSLSAGAFDSGTGNTGWVRSPKETGTSALDDLFPPQSSEDAQSLPPSAPDKRQTITLPLRMVRAGFYRKHAAQVFSLVRIVLTASAFGLGTALSVVFTSLPLSAALLIGSLLAVAGIILPSFWLDHRLRKRQTKMRRALPDALDLITVCLHGGLSLSAGLSRVARELGTAHPVLAVELGIVERESQMGLTTGDAMRQFASRFDLEELRSLASVISQAQKFGGSIAQALATYAESMRTKRRIRAEEMAQKAAVKLLFPTLFCIFPGIFVVILGPTAIRIWQVLLSDSPW